MDKQQGPTIYRIGNYTQYLERKHNGEGKKVKVTQSCLTLCDPKDYTIHGILQARILEWLAFPFCRRSSQPRDQIRSPTLEADSLPAKPPGKPKNTGVGSLSLLQQIFPTQEIKPRSPTLQVDSLPAEAPGKPLLRHENQISSF